MLRRLSSLRNRSSARQPGARFVVITSARMLMNDLPAVQAGWRLPGSRASIRDTAMQATNQPHADIDAALATWAKREGARPSSHPPLRHMAFTHTTGISGCLWHNGGQYLLVVKGAPEHVLARCDLTESERERVILQQHKFAAQGYRTVALAYRTLARPIAAIDELTKRESLEFAGLIALADTMQPRVRQDILQARKAGVIPVLITGDHPEAAYHHGRRFGLVRTRGQVLDARHYDVLNNFPAPTTTGGLVFARATPERRERIINELATHGTVSTPANLEDFHRLMHRHPKKH